ncbi:hypothetical protein [Actinotalea sp.]|uniref:DUF7666 domain-containing protein n=1 Tax=Actinotalea sp. TaxID=1872145 RepID=UPI003561CF85
MSDVVKAIKGFNPDLTCRGFQFAEGKEYTHDGNVDVCSSGFHAVTQPIDVFAYYPPATSVYHEVEVEGAVAATGGDSKVAGRVIRIGKRVELSELIQAQVEYVRGNAKAPTKSGHSTGGRGAASATGDLGAALAIGDYGKASTTGAESVAISTGYDGAAKGAIGCWIVLTERNDDGEILGVVAKRVDGERIKADTYYALRGGKVVPA